MTPAPVPLRDGEAVALSAGSRVRGLPVIELKTSGAVGEPSHGDVLTRLMRAVGLVSREDEFARDIRRGPQKCLVVLLQVLFRIVA